MDAHRLPISMHRHRATKHMGWSFSAPAEFEARASSFLAQGARNGERLIFAADDPNVNQWPKVLLDRGDLLVFSTAEVYGPDKVVVAASQRAEFEALLAEALRHGYTGIRVCGDGTSLIDGPERLAAFLAWDREADRLIARHAITALCSFDRTRADADSLQAAMAAHRVIAPPAPTLGR